MSNPWTPGPWGVEECHGEGSVYIVASGNPLLTRGRSRRAKTHRAMIAAAPEMAEVLKKTERTWFRSTALRHQPETSGMRTHSPITTPSSSKSATSYPASVETKHEQGILAGARWRLPPRRANRRHARQQGTRAVTEEHRTAVWDEHRARREWETCARKAVSMCPAEALQQAIDLAGAHLRMLQAYRALDTLNAREADNAGP